MGADCCAPQLGRAGQHDTKSNARDHRQDPRCPSPVAASRIVSRSGNIDDDQHAGSSVSIEGTCQGDYRSAPQPVVQDNCNETCCASSKLPVQHGCCASKITVEESLQDDKVTPRPSMENPNEPFCCKYKASPCCDTLCLDRLALRECQGEKLGDTASVYSCSSESGTDKPCDRHKDSIRERHAARLEAIGCICRTLLALGKISCCTNQVRSSVARRKGVEEDCTSVDSRGATDTTGIDLFGKAKSKQHSTSMDSFRRKMCCAQGRCDAAQLRPPSIANFSVDECCDEKKNLATLIVKSEDVMQDVVDLEKGVSESEHIILSISGMTCSGCETKLHRTLGSLPSIRQLKTSLILSRAEFDLDLACDSVARVMKHLERTTEFKCERVFNQGSSIDVITLEDAEDFLKRNRPRGVNEMIAIGRKMVRLTFDPKIVGARDLLEKGFTATPSLRLAPPQADATLEAGSKHVRHVGYMTILSAILTLPVLVLAWAPLPEHDTAYESASLALATIVQIVIAGPFYPTTLKSLMFSRAIEMDLLIVLSTTTAYVFSLVSFGYMVSGQPLSTGSFFETSTLLVTLIMVGRYVTALARQKAVESISVRSLQAQIATLVQEDGSEQEIDARILQYGDCFKVAPESRVPTDGTVIAGESDVDESMLTGESKPVEKQVKSALIAGSVNGLGVLTARVTRLPGENTISTVASMVDEAKLSKPKIQDIADKVASYFVPITLCLTTITFVLWVAIGIAVRNQSGSEAVIIALTFAITVLIVSCPCAIGLAVPMVIVISSGVAANTGVIFKSAESLEIAHKTSHVVFDKTGTLTQGTLAVVLEDMLNDSESSSVASLLLGLVSGIKHPVSAAVASHLRSKSIIGTRVNDVKVLPGKGIEGTSPSGAKLRAGNSRWLNLLSDLRVRFVLDKGYTAFCFTVNGSLVGVMGLTDTLRPDALQTVSKLQSEGITVCLLSGDDDAPVRSIATQLDIANHHVRSRCTPADKQEYIQELLASPIPSRSGKKSKTPIVVFCGDGTNDAIALAQATIGVHINEGTDVARSAANVVLMRPNLYGVVTMINTSKAAMRRIRFNFGWSFVYNLFAILLAAGAFVDARIPPAFAGLGEVISVLPVIVAAVLLRWQKF